MQNYVFVLDQNRKPVAMAHPGHARKLLSSNAAAVFRRYPFTIILKETAPPDFTPPPLRVKLDPGAKTTGIAVLDGNRVIWAAELQHRGALIRDALTSRRQLRCGRRGRKTRYREPRFLNRTRPKGWLPPSLESRVANIMTWINRLGRLAPLAAISQELVRFDTQQLQNPEISGIQYQQGTLFQYEVREYLLEKWRRRCCYCGAQDTPLEVEHIVPRARGGSNRVSNLALACVPCNQQKGSQDVRDFLADKPDLLVRILQHARTPLNAAAAVNTTRWALFGRLRETGLPVEVGTGGRTKFNRTQQSLPKAHWIDAACVGASTPTLQFCVAQPLLIAAKGHGNRQMCGTDKYGFPIRHRTNQKNWFGFQTGDIVRARVPSGKFAGQWVGRIAVRSRPSFKLTSSQSFDVHPKYLEAIHRADGYAYSF